MNSIRKKMLLTQFFTHIMGILIIVVLGIIFTPGGFEKSFMLSWIISHSGINYIRFMIPITLTGLAICFSMSIRHEDTSALRSTSFFYVIRGTLVFLLVLVLVYVLFVLVLWPRAYRQRALAESRSEFINSRIARGIAYLDQEEYLLANEEAESVLRLLPLHPEGVELYREIQNLMPETPVPSEIEAPPPTLPLGLEYSDISTRAELYFGIKDYLSAVFYARLALGPREERDDPVARRILTESLRIIASLDLSESEESERELFYLKRSGAEAYNRGELIDAYYIFKEVQEISSLDLDAITYLEDIQPKIQNISFFSDEIDAANPGEMRRNIFIRIPALSEREGGDPSPTQRFLAAEQMMRNSAGVYFIDLEYLEIAPTGITHVRAPRAKLSGTYLIMRVIDREQRGEIHRPEYLQGSGESNILAIPVTGDELWVMTPASAHFDDISTAQLFSLSQLYTLFGRNPAFPQAEILYRILLPLSLMTSSLFVIALSWRNRSRYIKGPPGYTLIFFPLIPLFVFGLFEFYIVICRNILTSVLLLTNFTVALITLLGLQALFFIIILFVLAGQKNE